MYHTLGYSFVNYLKALMTFQPADVNKALECLKHTINLASALRKKDAGLVEALANFVRGSAGVATVKAMTRMQRHAVIKGGTGGLWPIEWEFLTDFISINAITLIKCNLAAPPSTHQELVYAEAYLLKAIISIVHDETLVAFIREGLNIRSSYTIYRSLQKFLEVVDAEIDEAELADPGHGGARVAAQYEIDEHLTSGVSLGIGLFNLMLSLLPTTVLKVFEIIGFSGNRAMGVSVLESIGGWSAASASDPSLPPPLQLPVSSETGLRRQFADMALLVYHTVISSMVPCADASPQFAAQILAHNLHLYPRSAFFLYFSARLRQARRHIPQAVESYETAIAIQADWKQLHHICYWELGLCHMVSAEYTEALRAYVILCKESNWSKAVYTYQRAICAYVVAMGIEEERKEEKEKTMKEVEGLMGKVPGLLQKIAGKSIPIEVSMGVGKWKFVARKARKFLAQSNRLLLPGLELLHVWNCYEIMPLVHLRRSASLVESEIAQLEILLLSSLSGSDLPYDNFYDDFCLAHFLRGILLRQQAFYTDPDAPALDPDLARHHTLVTGALESFRTVFREAWRIRLDHYLYYFARYEMGRTLVLMGDTRAAKEEFAVVLARQPVPVPTEAGLAVKPAEIKGKYSLENMVIFKTHNSMAELDELVSGGVFAQASANGNGGRSTGGSGGGGTPEEVEVEVVAVEEVVDDID
ncbi:hypothetical protein BC938DRAFT_476107 [Jimgerdemannia flammicorona]|uniref:Uncharacterized protein n=1 Tax=Jimgerdemannia flammicorona TaxID=994334 RepID=A0A433QQW2_9FUNG|nr:hypothetical protein BC938DRAFT_476107 [Jimgerdemannia flammicorona]